MKAIRFTLALVVFALAAACTSDVTGPGRSIRANSDSVIGSPG